MNELRAEFHGHRRKVVMNGANTAADAVTRFKDYRATPGVEQFPRCGQTRDARSYDDYVR